MYLKFNANEYRRHIKCICGIPECRDIVKEFRKIKDVRPNPNPNPNPFSGKETDYAKNCRHYNNRIAKHFPAARDSGKAICNEAPEKETRSSKPTKKHAQVALWHFDKRILRSESCFCVGNSGAAKIKWFLSEQNAKDLGLYNHSSSQDILYTNADKCKYPSSKGEEVIALVPTMYNMSVIKQDLDDAYQGKQEEDLKEQAKRVYERKLKERKLKSDQVNVTPSPSNKRQKPNASFPVAKDYKDIESYFKAVEKIIEELTREKEAVITILEETNLKLNASLAKTMMEHELCQEKNKEYKAKIDELQNPVTNQVIALSQLGSGLNRISLVTGSIFETKPDLCNELFGFPEYDFMIEFLEAAFELKYQEPSSVTLTKGGNGDAGLSELEQVMVALLYMNTTHSLDVIGQIFGIQSKNTVSKYLNKWIPELGELGDMLSSFLPLWTKIRSMH